MTIDAIKTYNWPASNIAARLRRHPSEVRKLGTYRAAIQIILSSEVVILTITPQLAAAATAVSQQWGLLSSDALIAAVMQAHGISQLASNDSDFDGIAGLVRFSPQ